MLAAIETSPDAPLSNQVLVRTHYYSKVDELDEEGEEFHCAQTLDQMDEVGFWVRNLDRQEKFSFRLQTATDKFYPDFRKGPLQLIKYIIYSQKIQSFTHLFFGHF